MTDTPEPATSIAVAASDAQLQVRGQLRLLLAALAGAMVGKHLLPAGLANDTVLDVASALLMMGFASAWQWARVRLQHSRLWALAVDRRVPNDLIQPATLGEHPVKIFGYTITASSLLALIGSLSPVQKAVAALRKTDVGRQVEEMVRTIDAEQLSGADKFAKVLASAMPLIARAFSSDDRRLAASEVEDIARALVQDTYNDVLSKSATGVAALILRALGIK